MTSRSLKRFSYTLLVGPSVLVYALVIVFPVAASLLLSFTKWSVFGAPQFIGLVNYVQMFKSAWFMLSLRNNALVVAISVFGQIPLGFVLAYFIYRRLVRGGKFFEVMIFLPITISQIVVAILWNRIFTPVGMLTQLVRALTGNHDYSFLMMTRPLIAIVPVLFVILWMYTGLYMIIILANLQKIPISTVEAAVMDGAKEGQILGRVIIPAMVNVLFTMTVLAISGSFTGFALIYAMTSGGPAHYTYVLALYMYQNTFYYYEYGFGSAVSIVIVALSMGLIGITQAISRFFERRYE